MSIEALKLALEALEKLEKHNRGVKITTIKTGEVIHPAQIAQEAITSLQKAIAEAENKQLLENFDELKQEPVATWENKYGMKEWQVHALRAGWSLPPPQHQWIGLTEDEITGIILSSGGMAYSAIKFTQNKLKEKNT
jgi:hypothetical protein